MEYNVRKNLDGINLPKFDSYFKMVMDDDGFLVEGNRYGYDSISSLEYVCVSTTFYEVDTRDTSGGHHIDFVKMMLNSGETYYVLMTTTASNFIRELKKHGIDVSSLEKAYCGKIKKAIPIVIGIFAIFLVVIGVFIATLD